MIITIDGNIGSGKSTLLKLLEKKHYSIHTEPVSDWEPFLVDMYKNNKDAFEFQVKVWSDRCFTPYYPKNKITCVERSPYYQWHVFSIANYMNGKLNDRQMEVLTGLYKKPCYHPDLSIYLRTDPAKCMERIHYRHRECENEINYDYIYQLHDLHEITYAGLTQQKVVVEIENKTPYEICDEVNNIILNYKRQHKDIVEERF